MSLYALDHGFPWCCFCVNKAEVTLSSICREKLWAANDGCRKSNSHIHKISCGVSLFRQTKWNSLCCCYFLIFEQMNCLSVIQLSYILHSKSPMCSRSYHIQGQIQRINDPNSLLPLHLDPDYAWRFHFAVSERWPEFAIFHQIFVASFQRYSVLKCLDVLCILYEIHFNVCIFVFFVVFLENYACILQSTIAFSKI